jgi:hypothetical protein
MAQVVEHLEKLSSLGQEQHFPLHTFTNSHPSPNVETLTVVPGTYGRGVGRMKPCPPCTTAVLDGGPTGRTPAAWRSLQGDGYGFPKQRAVATATVAPRTQDYSETLNNKFAFQMNWIGFASNVLAFSQNPRSRGGGRYRAPRRGSLSVCS